MSRGLLLSLTIATGLSVANLYYNQPLLALFQREFHASARAVATIPTSAQIGYGLGMLFLVPLGDMLQPKRLIVVLSLAVTLALFLNALAPSIFWLAAASALVGFTTVVPQVIIPFATRLAPAARSGQVVGTLMTGLLAGILLARTVSGFLAESFGWRVAFVIAGVISVGQTLFLAWRLPAKEPVFQGGYVKLMRSLWDLTRDHATLREAAFLGAIFFASLSAFWSTLAFKLAAPPFGFGPRIVGLFGLVGGASASAAPMVGRLSDRHDPRRIVFACLVGSIVSYAVFWMGGWSVAGLVTGVILLDVAVQSGHIANQTRIYRLLPEARGRVNTVYMFFYFVGGSLGSYLGGLGWSLRQWPGVCAVGIGFLALGLAVFLLGRPKEEAGPVQSFA